MSNSLYCILIFIKMYQLSSPRVNKETRNPDEKARLLNCWKKNLPFKILLKPLKIKGLKEQHQKRRKHQRGVSGKREAG